jgi:hypothetical protein
VFGDMKDQIGEAVAVDVVLAAFQP